MYSPAGTKRCDCGYEFAEDERKPLRRQPSPMVKPINRILALTFFLSAGVFLTVTFRQPKLPRKTHVLPELFQAPEQSEDAIPPPFEVEQGGLDYLIDPQYNYRLYGLVVSGHDSESLSDVLHETWHDYLNVMDLCVIWGPNIENEVYQRVEFSSGNFTCYCQWFDEETGRQFHMDAISNNHLLADSSALARRVRSVMPGDQIYLEGYLAKYENPAYGFKRGTSTVRNDTGNGACETVYLTDFVVLKRGQPLRPWIRALTGLLALASLVGFMVVPFVIRY